MRHLSPSQIRKRHAYLCRWKIAFAVEADAQQALATATDWATPDKIAELGIYVCQNCGFLHIGHTPTWRQSGSNPVLGEEKKLENQIALQPNQHAEGKPEGLDRPHV